MQPINIFTEPINIINIEECSIFKTVNEHFHAVVSGYIQLKEENESYFEHILETTFIIKSLTEKQEEIVLFRGMICDIHSDAEGGLTRISICAQSKTAKLDQQQHLRVYQGKDQKYREIIDTVLSFHKNTAIIQPKGKGVSTAGLIIQYKETDWQFLKRLASQLHTVLVADCTNDHICFFFGNPEKKESELDISEYRMRRYRDFKQRESIEYIIKSRKIKNLCEYVNINGSSYYIYQIKSHMQNQELEFEYTLRPSSGFETSEVFNTNMAGSSIMGEVAGVSDTYVRINLFSDADYDFGKPSWFPFSTVYSSPDGTGWYCMPEEGDRIRLYIPDGKEQTAYVVSAVHLENDCNLRKNVNEKSIRTKYQKEIRLTPDKIIITNHKGISIILDDNAGITIKSNRKINIISENEIEIKGEQVQIEGKQGVYLMEGSNMLMVRDGIKEQGMNIEHR